MLKFQKKEQNLTADKIFDDLPQELLNAIKMVYEPMGIGITNIYKEEEGRDYGACRLKLDGREIVFRVAKTTPKKMGQFVTVWQRPCAGVGYMRFNARDKIDFIIISVTDNNNIG